MSILDWFGIRKRTPEPPDPISLEEAGDRVAQDLVDALDYINNYLVGGVPDAYDRWYKHIEIYWRFRGRTKN